MNERKAGRANAAKRGPGRPKGSFNRNSIRLMADAAKDAGLPPHEFLLAIMRCEYALINGVKYEPTFEQRFQAARDAAPFYAPRLSAIDIEATRSNEDLRKMIVEAVIEMNDPVLLDQLGKALSDLVQPDKS